MLKGMDGIVLGCFYSLTGIIEEENKSPNANIFQEATGEIEKSQKQSKILLSQLLSGATSEAVEILSQKQ
jgi:hypothetical protein